MRIYVDTDALATASEGMTFTLPDAQAHHVGRVMRRRVGDAVRLFDGRGHEFEAVLSVVDRKCVEVTLGTSVIVTPESPISVHLGQAISKGDRMDIAIQKSVELGVAEITPLYTERGDVRLKGEREERKWQHWLAVAASACEQCGRATLPVIHAPMTLDAWLEQRNEPMRLMLQPGRSALEAHEHNPGQAALLIGPEGGFTQEEIEHAAAQHFDVLSLGPRILRTETAPIAALTLLQYRYGDLR